MATPATACGSIESRAPGMNKHTAYRYMTVNVWGKIQGLCPLPPRLTALVVKALSMADLISQPVFVDHQALSDSVAWLMRSAQQPDGSFADRSSYRPNKLVVSLHLELLPSFLSSPFFQPVLQEFYQCPDSSAFFQPAAGRRRCGVQGVFDLLRVDRNAKGERDQRPHPAASSKDTSSSPFTSSSSH